LTLDNRVDKLVIGSFGDCKTIAANLFELRLFFGQVTEFITRLKEERLLSCWLVGSNQRKPGI
jgi:putative component of toxin-antitoxin plasmid stabilization module